MRKATVETVKEINKKLSEMNFLRARVRNLEKQLNEAKRSEQFNAMKDEIEAIGIRKELTQEQMRNLVAFFWERVGENADEVAKLAKRERKKKKVR